MRLALAALLVVVPLLASACRVPCDADEKPTAAQLAREQKATYRGQPICRQLLAPEVTVTADRIVLKAVQENVIDAAELGPRLVQYREHFRAVRAAEPYDATITFRLDPTVPSSRVIALLAAAASAGIPRMHLEAGRASADLTVVRTAPPFVPGPTAATLVQSAFAAHTASLPL